MANLISIRYYLSDRFRLRFEDANFEDLLTENNEISEERTSMDIKGIDMKQTTELGKESSSSDLSRDINKSNATAAPVPLGQIRTLDGKIAGDEFAADSINYQVLLGKIDELLERLRLDA